MNLTNYQSQILKDKIEKISEMKLRSNKILNEIKQNELLVPRGQPILNNHYSEKSCRKHYESVDKKMKEIQKIDNQIKNMEYTMSRVGKKIENSDPEKNKVLLSKIKELEKENSRRKLINEEWKKIYGSDRTLKYSKSHFHDCLRCLLNIDNEAVKSMLNEASLYNSPNYSKIKPYKYLTSEIKRLKSRI